jgi:hypothetical protein
MADEKKREGSGKSPTKFMERPGAPKKEKEQEQSHPEFINDDLDVLENQEKQDEDTGTTPQQGPSKPGHKGDEKPDPRKFQEPEKTDTGSEDKGGDAC